MKNLKFCLSILLFFSIFQHSFGQYDYVPGKEFTIRSKVKEGITCVTTLRIDTSLVAHINFRDEKSLPSDLANYVILAPEGELTAKLSSEAPGILIRVPESDPPYYYVNYDTKREFLINGPTTIEGEGINKLIQLKHMKFAMRVSDAAGTVISSDKPSDLHSSFLRNGDVLEFSSPGILFKAKKVLFDE